MIEIIWKEEENENDQCEVHDSVNRTFQNPSKVDTCDKLFDCRLCDFKGATKIEIVNHNKTSHNWCSLCFFIYDSQEKLMDHIPTHWKITGSEWTHQRDSPW